MRCIIPSCDSQMHFAWNKGGVSTHRFPSDPERYRCWRRVLSISGLKDLAGAGSQSNVRICSRHFRTSVFYSAKGKRKLIRDAVPSLNLGGDFTELDVIENDDDDDVHIVQFPACSAEVELLNDSVVDRSVELEPIPITTAKPYYHKRLRYSGDLKSFGSITAQEAKLFLPNMQKQLKNCQLRVNRLKQRNLRLQKSLRKHETNMLLKSSCCKL